MSWELLLSTAWSHVNKLCSQEFLAIFFGFQMFPGTVHKSCSSRRTLAEVVEREFSRWDIDRTSSLWTLSNRLAELRALVIFTTGGKAALLGQASATLRTCQAYGSYTYCLANLVALYSAILQYYRCDTHFAQYSFREVTSSPKRYRTSLAISFTEAHLCDTPSCNIACDNCAISHKNKHEKLWYDRYKYRVIRKVSLLGL